jgi:hypothetical protein
MVMIKGGRKSGSAENSLYRNTGFFDGYILIIREGKEIKKSLGSL